MKKKVLVIYNPMSGARKLINAEALIKETLEKEGYAYDFFMTLPQERQPLERFLGKKYDRIVVAGGDGTVAEVTSFLIHNKLKTPLVIIPRGSANLLALSLGIPMQVRWALLHGLKKEGKLLDAMCVNRKYYGMIAAGLGYDTMIMKKTTRTLKRKLGFFAYLWTVLKTIFVYRSQPYYISVDGYRQKVMAKTILAFNLLPMGDIKLIKPVIGTSISPNDGLLNVFAVNPRPVRELFRFKKIFQIFEGKQISIKTKKERHFQIDGNVYKGKSLTIDVLPQAIRIVY